MTGEGSRGGWWTAPAVVALTVGAGYAAARLAIVVHGRGLRTLPWIMGRSLGLAAFVALALLVVAGTWLRHPWRRRLRLLHPETSLRLHAALGAAAVVLVAGHVVFLATDRYAGVGWRGVVLPGSAAYRPWPVALGVLAAYGLAAVSATAAFGGRLVAGRWLAVHRLAAPVFALTWFHGVLAGTDTARLRAFYAVTGLVVAGLWVSRHVAAASTRRGARAGVVAPVTLPAPDAPAAPGMPPAPVPAARRSEGGRAP